MIPLRGSESFSPFHFTFSLYLPNSSEKLFTFNFVILILVYFFCKPISGQDNKTPLLSVSSSLRLSISPSLSLHPPSLRLDSLQKAKVRLLKHRFYRNCIFRRFLGRKKTEFDIFAVSHVMHNPVFGREGIKFACRNGVLPDKSLCKLNHITRISGIMQLSAINHSNLITGAGDIFDDMCGENNHPFTAQFNQ